MTQLPCLALKTKIDDDCGDAGRRAAAVAAVVAPGAAHDGNDDDDDDDGGDSQHDVDHHSDAGVVIDSAEGIRNSLNIRKAMPIDNDLHVERDSCVAFPVGSVRCAWALP